jgi:ABC-type polysaccharide/polyol phosphate export permease
MALFVDFFSNVWKRRSLAITVGYAELQQTVIRYPLSYLWWLLDPLLLMVCYVVLVTVLGRGFERDGVPYYLFVSAGILPWFWTITCVNSSLRLVIQYAAPITQINFPIYTLVIARFIKETALYLVGLLIFLSFLLLWGSLSANWLYVPLILLLHGFFIISVMTFFAAIGVFIPDLEKLLPFILRLWFFITPILYEANMLLNKLTPELGRLYMLNPMAYISENMRAVLLFSQPMQFDGIVEVISISFAIWFLSIWLFIKNEPNFSRHL